jgi:hypothetical protein
MLQAICPKSVNHKRFSVVAHVAQEWIVDEHGTFIKSEDECTSVVHTPDKDDVWVCWECGTAATVKEE